MARRTSPFAERRRLQRQALDLPAFPTTTIGSFPQTDEVRKARASHAKGTLSNADYEAFLRRETEAAIRWQEEIGIDVLVHGDFERNRSDERRVGTECDRTGRARGGRYH